MDEIILFFLFKVMEPKPQKPIIAMHFTVDGHSNVLGTSNSNEKCSKSTGKNTKTKVNNIDSHF